MQLDHLAGGSFHPKGIKGRTIRKVVWGVGEKTKKKFMQGKMPRQNIHAKKKVKKKNSCRRKVNCDFFRKSEFLSESLSFRNQQYYQGQYE